ncbi:MAG: nucleotidyltransferase domain-containing protein, partial [Vicinamibacteria bacterium]
MSLPGAGGSLRLLRFTVQNANELRLLVTSARLFMGMGRDDEVIGCLSPQLDWDALSDLAAREGMSGIVAVQLERLTRTHHLRLPLEPFTRALRGTFATNGALFAELLGLRSELQKEGTRVLLLKGGALMTTAYGGQLGLRPLSDLDLLVKESELPVVRRALFERGFHPATPSGTLLTKGGAMFDLHTDLVNASRIRTRALAFQFDPETIWTKAVALDPGEPTFLILSPAHQFLHLAVHALKHSFSRLIWFLDLALVARQLDWEELLLQAQNTGTMRSVAYAVDGMTRLLG